MAMGLKVKLLALMLGLLFFAVVIAVIKRRAIKPAYAVLWIAVSLFLMSVPVLESFYVWFTYSVLGIIDARHTIYIGLIGFLLVYVLYLTMKVSRMDDRIQQVISHLAVFERSAEDRKDRPDE
jgi:hypothetical protein